MGEVFSHFIVIWCEVMNHVKYLEREWTDDVPLSFRMGKKDNDREINEWYNEVKLGRQIGICGGISVGLK
ncbi:hypothetical protein B5F86_15060 [Lachnoclostridium sp. An298]|nr:hypothetical protein B5F86_15060 [Lachnoclostridium sp. An298]